MEVGSSGAAKAYQMAQKIIDQSSSSTSGSGSATGSNDFSSLVSGALKNNVNVVKNSETVSAQAITGQASLTDVVTAVNSADIALKSVVAVRDKVIGAYQDIIKMPI